MKKKKSEQKDDGMMGKMKMCSVHIFEKQNMGRAYLHKKREIC